MTRPPSFDAEGTDCTTYHPWWLQDHGPAERSRHDQPRYVLGIGVKWSVALPTVLHGYYVAGLSPGFFLNGPGLSAVAVATLHDHWIDGVWTDHEADACLVGLETLADAARAGTILSDTFRDPVAFHRAVLLARKRGLEYG